MIISFDIDNTLIPYSDEFEVKQINPILKTLGVESLRIGTTQLFSSLEKAGHEIWIYTTSYRSIFNLKKTFKLNGLSPNRLINGAINQKTLATNNCTASKNPNLFGIDLHIDDSHGVFLEGTKFGFKTILVNPADKHWVEKVIKGIKNSF